MTTIQRWYFVSDGERPLLNEKLPSTEQALHEQFLYWRGIRPGDECKRCAGSGSKVYTSTATWRGGIGGQAMTSDVCDLCWGSGDSTQPWVNLRQIQGERRWFRNIVKFAP